MPPTGDPAALRVPAGVRQFAPPSGQQANAGARPTPPRAQAGPQAATSSFSAVEAGSSRAITSVRDLAAAFGAMSPSARGRGHGGAPTHAERVRAVVRVRPPQEGSGPPAVDLDMAFRTVTVRRR